MNGGARLRLPPSPSPACPPPLHVGCRSRREEDALHSAVPHPDAWSSGWTECTAAPLSSPRRTSRLHEAGRDVVRRWRLSHATYGTPCSSGPTCTHHRGCWHLPTERHADDVKPPRRRAGREVRRHTHAASTRFPVGAPRKRFVASAQFLGSRVSAPYSAVGSLSGLESDFRFAHFPVFSSRQRKCPNCVSRIASRFHTVGLESDLQIFTAPNFHGATRGSEPEGLATVWELAATA